MGEVDVCYKDARIVCVGVLYVETQVGDSSRAESARPKALLFRAVFFFSIQSIARMYRHDVYSLYNTLARVMGL